MLGRLVCKHDYGEDVSATDTCAIRLGTATLLLALLEGTERRAEVRLLQVLDLERIGEVAADCFRGGSSAAGDNRSADASLVEAGYTLYTLLRHLYDYHDEAVDAGVTTARALPPLSFDPAATGAVHARGKGEGEGAGGGSGGDKGGGGSSLRSRGGDVGRLIRRCELVNAVGELERVYFRVPDYCLLLTEESKQELLWGVDRETPGMQIQESARLPGRPLARPRFDVPPSVAGAL